MNLSRTNAVCLAGLTVLLLASTPAHAQRWMENLDRGVVAVNQGTEGVFVSWRLLGTEPSDLRFNVYRQMGDSGPVKLNREPLAGPTHFTDTDADLTGATRYFVRAVVSGEEEEPKGSFTLPAHVPRRAADEDLLPLTQPSPLLFRYAGRGEGIVESAGRPKQDYLAIPLQTPPGYQANDASVGDLDGDGRYELVVHMVGQGSDNSRPGLTTEPILDAYRLDGTRLWSINLGKNIREGAHYTQFMVYDLDCDGKAEVVCKTADGTVDGVGKVIGDAEADHRYLPDRSQPPPRRSGKIGYRYGFVVKGPEYLTVFDGETGAALETVDYVPQRHPETHSPTPEQMNEVWGDGYGNRIDRFLACVAYLDGVHPSVVMCRGYYTRTVLVAWDWRDCRLTRRWVFDSDVADPSKQKWRGQGNHGIAVADVDEDGRDEIIYGAMAVDDDGTGLYSTGFGHGDAQHTTDLDPNRPGLETWSIHEHPPADRPGVEFRNARTGEVYFAAAYGRDVGRGMAADIDPRHPGYELWGGTRNLFDVNGTDIGPRPRSQNMAIWWDGDLLRELLDGVNIYKWDYQRGRELKIFDGRAQGVASNNGTKSNPCLSADILGDWREELIAHTGDSRELRIYVSTIPTEHRMATLMHDPTYRLSVAWQNVGYNQPPHPGYFLGEGMKAPVSPSIQLTESH